MLKISKAKLPLEKYLSKITLCIKLPQVIRYVKHFDSNKTISFNVNDNKLFKKYNKRGEI